MQTTTPAFTTYRMFSLNSFGRIAAVAASFQAIDDQDAIVQAQDMAKERPAEVWLGARCIALLNDAKLGRDHAK